MVANVPDDEKSGQNVNPESYPNAPIVPIESYPMGRASQPFISPLAVEKLASTQPEKFLDLVQTEQQQRFELEKMRLQLDQTRLDREYDLELKRQESKTNEQASTKNTLRLALGAFVGIFISTLVYAGITGDKNLPDKVFTAAIGILGGGGATVLIKRPEQSQERKENDKTA